MRSANIFHACGVLALGFLFGGCNTNPPAAPKPTATPSTTAAKPAPTAVPNRDPYFLEFDKLSAKLTPEHEAQLNLLVPQLKTAKPFIVRGHSNRKEVGNPKEAALARALNVEKYLIQQGVPDKKMTIRFSTDDGKHGVEIDING
jgi:outer membrane protein OmpA-like peptidoglycan-associated protein